MISARFLQAAALAGALALASCASDDERETPSSAPSPAATDSEGARLASVGGRTITAEDVRRRLERLSPYERARYNSIEKKRELLDNMIRFEVLAKEALERGFDEHPDVVRRTKELMIQKMMEDVLGEELDPGDIPEAELRAHYEEHAEDFHRPEKVRASVIVVDDEARAESLAQKAQDAGAREFRELAEAHSIDATTRARGGDLRYFSRDVDELPDPVVEAAFSADAGEVVGPIEDGEGRFFILVRTGHREAVERPFEDVIRQVRNEVYRERRVEAQADFLADLREEADVEIRDEALRDLEISTGDAKDPPSDPSPAGAESPPGAEPARATDSPNPPLEAPSEQRP